MNTQKPIKVPYYEPQKNLADQIKHSSDKRGVSKSKFVLKKLKNYILSSLAYNCPINKLRVKFHRMRGVNIGEGVMIGFRCTLDHAYPEYIHLEDYSALAGDVYIITHSNPYKHFRGRLLSYVAPVIIREGAWVGINATILPGVEIGKHSVVGAGAVVTESVPENVVVSGNPAVIIKRFEEI